MMRKCVFGILLVAAVAIALSPSASANCGIPNLFAGCTAQTAACHYVHLGSTANLDSSSIIGRFWQPGARTSNNEGAYDETNWLIPYPPPADKFYINGNQNSGNGGCVAGEMIALVQTTTTDGLAVFAVGRVPQTPTAVDFDFSTTGDEWTAQPIPRPRVTSSSRVGNIVTLNIAIDPIAAAYHENSGNPATAEATVNAYRLLQASGTSDLGRNPAAYPTIVTTLPTTPSGATLTGFNIDCSTIPPGQDVLLATQLLFDGSQFAGDYASQSVRVKCNSTLAEPKFKIIDKKKPIDSIKRSPR